MHETHLAEQMGFFDLQARASGIQTSCSIEVNVVHFLDLRETYVSQVHVQIIFINLERFPKTSLDGRIYNRTYQIR